MTRPSDMRALGVWRPTIGRDYRVDFFNTFARNRAIYRVCQRSIVVRAAYCPAHARALAELRFAELEGVRDWRIHAAEVEVVPIGTGCGDPATDRTVLPLPEAPGGMPAEAKPARPGGTGRRVAKQSGSGKRSTS